MRITHWARLLAPLLALAACDADDSDTIEPEPLKSVPPPPAEAGAGDGSGATFAVTRYWLGSTTVDGDASTLAWETFGYDLDGHDSDLADSQHCRPVEGAAPASVLEDGPGGVDNAFGKLLLPMLDVALSYGGAKQVDAEAVVNADLGRATTGLVFRLDRLGTRDSYDPIAGFLSPALKDTNGVWARVESGERDFGDSYVSDDVWVLRLEGSTLDLQWGLAGSVLPFRLHRPTITMRLSADRARVTAGIVAGVLDAEELVASMRDMLGVTDPGFCEGGATEALLTEVRQASDIMVSGEQDPNVECDAISMAFGFEASAADPQGTAELPTIPTPCQP
ncbi:MAG: hypothetical protein U0271_02945 [Polyangiaceae bacterium]